MNSNRVAWLNPADPPSAFPSIHAAMKEPEGLLAAGGDLSEERLLYAYRHGIFPWYDNGQPILWWSPDPRCVLRPTGFHLARRLRRTMAKSTAEIVFNVDFPAVIRACAAPRRSEQGTWITSDMTAAYEALHRGGWAHSIEVRDGGRLIGGMYGLAIGRVFFGESMFSREENASKYALLALCQLLEKHDFELIDCQVVSGHLLSLGAIAMPRRDFSAILADACDPAMPFAKWPGDPISLPGLLAGGQLAELQ